MAPSYWLCKTEPSTYSFSELIQDRSTHWDNVRNFQARNFLRQMNKGDLVLIYHSGDDKAVVGVAEVIREAYPDPDQEGGDWSQVDLKAIKPLPNPVKLATIKSEPGLKDLLLVRHSRLSVMPATRPEFEKILKMAEKPKK